MRTLLRSLLVVAYISADVFDVDKCDVLARIKERMKGNKTDKLEKLLGRIREDFINMPKLREKLSGCKETSEAVITLSPEQKDFLQRLKSCSDTVPRKEVSNEEVNMKSRMAEALYQGDMLLSKEQQNEIISDIDGSRSKRQAYKDKKYPGRRWPHGVYYSLDGSLNETAKTAFKRAAELWMNNTCIDFIEDKKEEAEDLLLVFSEYGCWAEVGRQKGWQLLSLGLGCDSIGMATHEIGHALGFWHTHSRHDRDKYITVLEENIKPEKLKQFLKRRKRINNNYNLTYDYGSVMHYAATSFITESALKEGNFTILPKDVNYTETLGSKFIAFYDLLMMNVYYNCTGKFCSHNFVNPTLTSELDLVPVITYMYGNTDDDEEEADEEQIEESENGSEYEDLHDETNEDGTEEEGKTFFDGDDDYENEYGDGEQFGVFTKLKYRYI